MFHSSSFSLVFKPVNPDYRSICVSDPFFSFCPILLRDSANCIFRRVRYSSIPLLSFSNRLRIGSFHACLSLFSKGFNLCCHWNLYLFSLSRFRLNSASEDKSYQYFVNHTFSFFKKILSCYADNLLCIYSI